jgi:hypothetical protein
MTTQTVEPERQGRTADLWSRRPTSTEDEVVAEFDAFIWSVQPRRALHLNLHLTRIRSLRNQGRGACGVLMLLAAALAIPLTCRFGDRSSPIRSRATSSPGMRQAQRRSALA